MSKEDEMFQALACMGNASEKMSWANTWLENVKEVPKQTKVDMKKINEEIYRLQEQIRAIRNPKALNDKNTLEKESIALLELLDQNAIKYMLNHEGIGFSTQEEQDKARSIASENGLAL